MTPVLPPSFRTIVGELPEAGRMPDPASSPFETVQPATRGFVERGGVRSWYATWGEAGPWIAFAPIYQIVHSQMLKATVPYLSRHFRVLTMDGRGNGRSDRPADPAQYSFEHYYRDFLAVLDAAGVDRFAVVGISATAMTALRVAAEHPDRVTHVIVAGGFADMRVSGEKMAEHVRRDMAQMREDWPAHVHEFFSTIFSEPHSTKQFEDGVRYAWASTGEAVASAREGWMGNHVTDLATKIACPTLVIHGDDDRRISHARGEAIHHLVPGSRMLTIEGGGHVTAARDPVVFNQALRDFVAGTPRAARWTRAMSRKRRALFLSSPIGLGHVQRDVAIARELRKLHPDLEIDWFTVDPAAAYLEREGERVHPITARLAAAALHSARRRTARL